MLFNFLLVLDRKNNFMGLLAIVSEMVHTGRSCLIRYCSFFSSGLNMNDGAKWFIFKPTLESLWCLLTCFLVMFS